MPTYEYQCNTCGGVFDVFQSIKAAPLRKSHCESCGKPMPVKRLIGTGGAVLFKGSGFYQTDYRSEGYTKAAKAERDKAKGSGSDGGSKESGSKSGGESKTKPSASKGKSDGGGSSEAAK